MQPRNNWPLYTMFSLPIYLEFNARVVKLFGSQVFQGVFDIVHAITPILPRFPYAIVRACGKTPFVFGPVNGGLPYPSGFRSIALKEFGFLRWLKYFSQFLPGFRQTYLSASRILVGSSYTLDMLAKLFPQAASRMELFFENGIQNDFLFEKKDVRRDTVKLLFVGRLVPYKGADLVIEALHRLPDAIKNRVTLTIVGQGEEEPTLKALISTYNEQASVFMMGAVTYQETKKFFEEADVFCFPSIREFGGAVVLEAMAHSLPCIGINYGGIGEYIIPETGFKIDPRSRSYVIEQLIEKITVLVQDPALRKRMGQQAFKVVRTFTWEQKAQAIVRIYEQVLCGHKNSR